MNEELAEILAAREVIDGRLVRTPVHVLDGGALSDSLAGRTLVFKLEMLQRTGSFKIRGALNKLSRLSEEEKARGVVGMSSGNHAQALAYGARLEGLDATVVMPEYSMDYKIAATRAYGAQVEMVATEELFSAYERFHKERGLTPVHPFDDPHIIAGAGTAALELLDEVPEPDYVLAGVGGGGWISGTATAVKNRYPQAKVIGAEPQGACAVRRSLDAGRPVKLDSVQTIADGLAPPFTGEIVFDRIQRYVDDVILVSDDEILDATRRIIDALKVVVEPSAAACLAPLLAGKLRPPKGSTIAVMLSGGNLSAERLRSLLS